MNNSKNLRSRVEAAVERANLIDHQGEDLTTAFDSRLAGLERELEKQREQCRKLERENLDLNGLLTQLLDAVEQDRFGTFFKTAAERIDTIAGLHAQNVATEPETAAALDEAATDESATGDSGHDACEAEDGESDGGAPQESEMSSRKDGKRNIKLVSNRPDEQVTEAEGEDDDVAVMEVVERLSSLTHELAESESAG